MKKWMCILSGLLLLFSLSACGGKSQENNPSAPASEPAMDTGNAESAGTSSQAVEDIVPDTAEPSEEAENAEDVLSASEEKVTEQHTASGGMLVVYFSVPEDVSTDGVDAIAGASIVVKEDEVLGNTQYIANIIGERTGADLFRIEPEEPYPADHDPLVDLAAEEQDNDSRPAIANHIENPDSYDTIFIGFPNWWGDMPQILYTFLDAYDLSGKTIVPFCTHGGSGFSQTIASIAEMEPDATVIQDGYTVSRNDILEADSDVVNWLENLGY